MTKLAPLNEYQAVIQRDSSLDSYVIKTVSCDRLDRLKKFGRYATDQTNGVAKIYQAMRWIGNGAQKLSVANSFSKTLYEIGSTGYSYGGLLYSGHCLDELDAAIETVWKAPTRVNFVDLAYAIFEFAVSVLYALKLFIPACMPIDMAIGVVAPFSELSEFAIGVQQVYDSKKLAGPDWLTSKDPKTQQKVKDFYKQALADRKFNDLTDFYRVMKDDEYEACSNEIKKLADKWFTAKGAEALKALREAGQDGTDEAINTSLKNRCVVQLTLASEAKAGVTDVEVAEQIALATEVYGNTGEKQVKGWLLTAKTACALVNRILTWTLIILALTACVAVTATTAIGWTIFAVGGVSIVLSMMRANWSGDLKAQDNMTVDVATNALAQVETFKKQSDFAEALVV